MATNQGDRSFTELLENIVDNIQGIIRSEVRLAKAEIREETSKASRAGAVLAAGAVLGLYGLGFLLLTGVYALEQVMAPWLSALIVGVVVALISAILLMSGRKLLKAVHPTPERTVQTVKENLEWAKDQTR
jgi:uncharacterized membrane protein YqjE